MIINQNNESKAANFMFNHSQSLPCNEEFPNSKSEIHLTNLHSAKSSKHTMGNSKYYRQLSSMKNIFNKENNINLNYVLSLTNKNLKTLDSSHFSQMQISNVQVLDISDNRLTEVPLILANMKNLKILRMDNNLLKLIPEDLMAYF